MMLKAKEKYRPTCSRCGKRAVKYKWYKYKCVCMNCYETINYKREMKNIKEEKEYWEILRVSRGLPANNDVPIQTDT